MQKVMKDGRGVRALAVLLAVVLIVPAGFLMLGLLFPNKDSFAAQTGNPTITGVQNTTVVQGEYLNLYEGISAKDSLGNDISQHLLVSGNYDFSRIGSYDLVYSIADSEGNKASEIRKITVAQDKTGDAPTAPERPVKDGVNELGKGSFAAGTSGIKKPKAIVNLAENLQQKPVPSGDWWASLIIKNFGDRLICNPLMVKYANTGLAIYNPGAVSNPSDNKDNVDVFFDVKGMTANKTKATVVDHSDFGIAVSLSDDATAKMLTYVNQGSPYVYAKFSGGTTPVVRSGKPVIYYDDGFNKILETAGSKYTSDHIIIEAKGSGSKPTNYFVVNAPKDTVFTRDANNAVELTLPEGYDYVSVGAAPSKETVELTHEHGYAFAVATYRGYAVLDDTNEVVSDYYYKIWQADPAHAPTTLAVLLPHQHMQSHNKFIEDSIKTVRGDTRITVGNSFRTVDQFNGVLPSFVEPTNPEYSRAQLKKYLQELDENGPGNNASADAYGEGKSIQRIAQGAVMADQIGETALRDKFVAKLKSRLVDWLTYDKDKEAGKSEPYFYYENSWGALLQYSDAFGFSTNLADHHFHLGMLIFGCGVLASYDTEFVNNYKDMVDLVVRDYASPYRDDPLFCYMRSFDIFAGHSWAGGYADNVSGNNQESSSEALNAYAGMYLWGVASGNEELKNAGAYIFTTELSTTKEYWFNYSGTSFPDNYDHGIAGMVWGAAVGYGTWFSGDTHCIYGIQWIPTSEFLTSHVLSEREQERFAYLYNFFLKESEAKEGKDRYQWRDLCYPMNSLFDPDAVFKLWGDGTKLNSMGGKCDGETGARVYMFVNNMKSFNRRTSLIWAKNAYPASFYEKSDGKVIAQVWNPFDTAVEVVFANHAGDTQVYMAPPNSLKLVDVTLASVDAPEIPPGWYSANGGGGMGGEIGNGGGNGGGGGGGSEQPGGENNSGGDVNTGCGGCAAGTITFGGFWGGGTALIILTVLFVAALLRMRQKDPHGGITTKGKEIRI